MTDATSNRFITMLEKTGATDRVKSNKKIDFGESMAGDDGVNGTFRALHLVASVPTEDVAVSVTETIIIQPVNNQDEQSNSLIVTPLDGLTVTQSDRNTVTTYNGETVTLSHHHTITPSHTQTFQQFQTNPQTHPQTPMQYVPLEVLSLAYNQAIVLEYLIGNISGKTNARAISDYTKITIPSVRDALQRLVTKGFMHKPVTVRDVAFQGFSYVLNKALCDHFMNAGGLAQLIYRNHKTCPETVRPSDGNTVSPSHSLTAHSSSKSFQKLKPTTTPNRQSVSLSDSETLTPSNPQTPTPSNGFILTGAVGIYWEGEGLCEKQAQKWCQQFEVNPEQMRQHLDWARFDLELNGRREEVTKDPVSWFFGHLRTTGGCFLRPVNYRSPLEIRAEEYQQQQDRDKLAMAKIEEIEFENNFREFLEDKDAPLYKQLLSQINSFAKEQLKSGDMIFAEIELRRLFKEMKYTNSK